MACQNTAAPRLGAPVIRFRAPQGARRIPLSREGRPSAKKANCLDQASRPARESLEVDQDEPRMQLESMHQESPVFLGSDREWSVIPKPSRSSVGTILQEGITGLGAWRSFLAAPSVSHAGEIHGILSEMLSQSISTLP